ncbi:hypothetical protein R1flu_028930 [Riccia fluitans]|uniref:Uncharacterized protein n=1 Tax=Riccia fluitans TaxID=41844 RepID=A0ABD1XN29_9MARC
MLEVIKGTLSKLKVYRLQGRSHRNFSSKEILSDRVLIFCPQASAWLCMSGGISFRDSNEQRSTTEKQRSTTFPR